MEVIAPDELAAAAIGLNLMDASRAPAAATEGVRQGEELARQLKTLWS